MLLAGLTPVAFLFLAIATFVRSYIVKIRKKRKPSLYGETDWASDRELQKHRITSSKVPY